jgi:structural maintenance of chromosome 3 (chondroitin sulfate proteoglycan 6)
MQTIGRRELGCKGVDSYHVDNKPTKRAHVVKLMEAAGFSCSNPFYLVHQGQIADLANCSGEKRLNVIKELAGVSTFDAMEKVAHAQIKEAERNDEAAALEIEALAKEAEELKGQEEAAKRFIELEKVRSGLQHVTYEKVKEKVTEAARKLEVEKESGGRRLAEAMEASANEERKRALAKADADYLKDILASNIAKRTELIESRDMEATKKNRQEEKITHAEEELATNKKKLEEGTEWCGKLEEEVANAEEQLVAREQNWREAKAASDEVDQKLRLKKKVQSDLYARSNRLQQFRTEEERNDWLDNEIGTVDELISNKIRERQSFIDSAQKGETDLSSSKGNAAELKDTLPTIWQTIKQLSVKLVALEKEILDLSARAEVLRSSLLSSSQTLQSLKNDREEIRAKKNRDPRMRQLIKGTESMLNILGEDDSATSGYYGVVAASFENDSTLDRAISVVLGQRLYFMIVKSAAIGSKLCKIMRNRKLEGEVNFIALDKLHNRPSPAFPAVCEKRARPILQCIKYTEEISRVMRFLFGNYVLVKDMSVFKEFRGTGWSCVTLEGDQMFAKGPLKGGYYDGKLGAPLTLFRQDEEAKERVDAETNENASAREKLEDIESGLMHARLEVGKNKAKIEWFQRKAENTSADIKQFEQATTAMREDIDEYRAFIIKRDGDLKELEMSKRGLEAELRGDDGGGTQEGRDLARSIEELTSDCKKAFKTKNDEEGKRAKLKTLLDGKLRPEMAALMAELDKLSASELELNEGRLQVMRLKLEAATLSGQQMEKRLETANQQIEKSAKKKTVHDGKIEVLCANCDAHSEAVEVKRNAMDAICSKEARLAEEKQKIAEAMSTVAAPPQAELERARALSDAERAKQLKTATKKMAKYEERGVDVRVVEQHKEVCKMKEQFEEQLGRIREERQHVLDLWDNIQMKRKEKTGFTYKQMDRDGILQIIILKLFVNDFFLKPIRIH